LREEELSIAMPPRREAAFTSATNAKLRTKVFQPDLYYETRDLMTMPPTRIVAPRHHHCRP
jgi:hypothetical protein